MGRPLASSSVVFKALTAVQNHSGPAWYPLALAATALPCAWLDGWLAPSRVFPG